MSVTLPCVLDAKGGKALVRLMSPEDVPELYKVINWAYRGKPGVEQWTGEGHLISGDRISQADLAALVASPANGTDYRLLVLELAESRQLVGCMKLELHDEGRTCEYGMFAIDPSFAGGGYGGALFAFALRYSKEVLGCKEGMIWVIDIRSEIVAWYTGKFGFKDTGKRVPFPPATVSVGQPKPEIVAKHGWLQFAVCTRPL